MALIEPNDLLVSSTTSNLVSQGVTARWAGQGPNDFVKPEDDIFKNNPLGSTRMLTPTIMPMSLPFPTLNQLEIEMDINYHGTHELEQKEIGNWIDLYLAEDYDLKAGEFKLLSLGISMELPQGFEAIIAPRSSTFKNYGILQANSIGVVDTTFCGDTDIWMFPAYATRDIHLDKDTRICQFRVIDSQPHIKFNSVESLGNEARSGFGSTGK